MPIQNQDVVILESDTMTDAAEGGGALTGNPIIDGASNNIFEDISTLDRVYGAVHMRKAFMAVNTQTNDNFFGSHAIISKLPGDARLGINLFNAGDWFDRRQDVRSRVENYRIKGAGYLGFLLDTQYTGSKVVTIFQGEDKPVPSVGEVLYLTQDNDNQNQYIRINKIDQSIQDFFDGGSTYRRRILAIEISQPLDYDFIGAPITRNDNITPAATIKTTVIPNAARYYSTRPLNVAAQVGDLTLSVDSIYSQIVPSSTTETSIVDADANGYVATLSESANGTVSFATAIDFAAGGRLFLGRPCWPGTLNITIGASTVTDSGGDLRAGGVTIGAIDYANGTLLWSPDMPTYTGNKTVTFKPSAAPVAIADTAMIPVEPESRGYVWNYTIEPAPKPGSVRLSYMSLGTWYTLKDDAKGVISGEASGTGVGSINYATGTLSVTLAALPDVYSDILISWGLSSRYYSRANITPAPLMYTHQLAHQGITPQTATITWNDGVARTLTADIYGNLTGDGTGTLSHTTGLIEFSPATMPLGGTEFTFDYQHGTPITQDFGEPVLNASNELVLQLGDTNVAPHTIEVTWNTIVVVDPAVVGSGYSGGGLKTHTARDDGAGALVGIPGSVVDYLNGTITFKPEKVIDVPVPTRTWIHNGGYTRTRGWYTFRKTMSLRVTGFTQQLKTFPFPQDGSGSVSVDYRAVDTDTQAQEFATAGEMKLELQNGFTESIIPGSLLFKIGTSQFIDRNGLLYTDVDRSNGSATYAGTIDYSTGVATLTTWPAGVANDITLQSMTTQIGRHTTSSIQFRIPVSPVRPLSLQMRAVPVNGGGQIDITADGSGLINQPGVEGWIDYSTGVVSVSFGDNVPATGNEAEPWYDANFIDVDGNIFKPNEIYADTVFYNAVTQSFFPLDAGILGLDPLRLPQDGRIPVYAPGDIVVVLHNQDVTSTYATGSAINLGRDRLAKIIVKDAAGSQVAATRYTADLDLGTITFTDLTGVSQPMTITNRIEDMAVIREAQITGQITLSRPLSHDYPIDETMVASAVVFGDLFARSSIPFDQQTWTGAWSDSLIGNQVTAQYNHLQHPVETDNASTIQERWAIVFTTATTGHLTGEHVGQIVQSLDIAADLAPINPNTGAPYFTLRAAGWGTGWSAGNVLRFNTVAANVPVWMIQSVAQGDALSEDLNFTLEFRGDIDTP